MLPYADSAVVEPSKVRDYLLSASHPIGRFKATVFFALGYTPENWQRLRDDLLALARTDRQRNLWQAQSLWPDIRGQWYPDWTVRAQGSLCFGLVAATGQGATRVCHRISGVNHVQASRHRR